MESTERKSWILRVAFVLCWMAVAALGVVGSAAARPGTLTGRVTNAATSVPLTNARVSVCTINGSFSSCTTAAVNASGVYTATVPVTVPATTSVAYTTNEHGLVNEVADDVPCPIQCDVSSARRVGTPFEVAPGAVVTKNFALSPAGTISGTVLDAVTGAPIGGIGVLVATRFNNQKQTTTVTTDASGVFSRSGLGPGTYVASIGAFGALNCCPTRAPLWPCGRHSSHLSSRPAPGRSCSSGPRAAAQPRRLVVPGSHLRPHQG